MKKISLFTKILLSLILISRIIWLYADTKKVPVFIDETYWIQQSYYYDLLFIKHDVTNTDWFNFGSYDQPPLAKYFIGVVLQTFQGKTIDSIGGIWQWYRGGIAADTVNLYKKILRANSDKTEIQKIISYNEILKSQLTDKDAMFISKADYMTVRYAMLTVGILSALILGFLCWYLNRSISISLLISIIFLSNPIVLPVFQRAMVDQLCTFFALLSILLLFVIFKQVDKEKISYWRNYTLSAVLGMILALALSTKFINTYLALSVTAVFIGNVIFLILRKKHIKDFYKKIFLRVGLFFTIAITAAALFVALNPFLYRDTQTNLSTMLKHRQITMEMHTMLLSGNLDTTYERVTTIFRNGITLGYGFQNIGLGLIILIYLVVFVAGIVKIISDSLHHLKSGDFEKNSIFIIIGLCTFLLNGIMVNMNWERYYIPFTIISLPLFGIGLKTLFLKLIDGKNFNL